MPRLLFLLLLAFSLPGLRAQYPDVDAWMDRHFGGRPGVKQDARADEALYVALGLDSLRRNRSIGEVSGTVRLPNGTMPMQFVLWADTLEAVLRIHTPGDTTTFAADLRTNTITFAGTGNEAGEVNTSVSDLRERVVVNWYRYQDDGSPWRVMRKVPYKSGEGILGQNMERWTVVNGDTIRFTRYGHGVSPFADALEWLPYGGDYPFSLFMQLARAGDPMPKMLKSRAGSIAVDIRRTGPCPRPAYRMNSKVLDTRGKAHRRLPIRRTNSRFSVLELDPVFTIPAGEEHRYATHDPGRPDEPEVSFTGTRSRARVHPKQPCGEAGTVVVRVWIDRLGRVLQAEVDTARSTLRSKACLDNALAAARKDTFHPMEAAMPVHTGELTFTYKVLDGRPGRRGDAGTGQLGVGDGGASGVGPGRSRRDPFPYELQGRTLVSYREIVPEPTGVGRVVLDIWVDRQGKVLRATPGRGTNTTAEDLVEAARKAALDTRFSKAPQAPEEQRGRLTVEFRRE